MKRIDTGFRLSRFKVKANTSLRLLIETAEGAKFELGVVDAALNGCGTMMRLDGANPPILPNLEPGDVVPESKLLWDDRECALGRLAVSRVIPHGSEGVFFGFSCVDARIPLMGALAGLFDGLERGADSPLSFQLSAKQFSVAEFAETEFEHPDLFERCRQYTVLLKDHKTNPLFQYYSVRRPLQGSRNQFRLSGSMRTVEAVSFASYDYLGYSDRPEVKEAAMKAVEKYGVSATGTMILSGKTDLHQELEARLARLFQKDDCILFGTGFATNVGTVTGLLRAGDLVVADIYSHASILDGIVASRAKTRYFRHNDLDNMDRVLEQNRSSAHGCLAITEGLFSMEGTTPDMRRFVEVARRHNARTYIDECHSIGYMGPNRLGVADRDGVLDEIDLYMGSFSKSLGVGACGFVVGNRDAIEWLRFFGRPGMFSAAVPPALVAACLKVLDLIQAGGNESERLQRNIRQFRTGLKRLGIHSPADDDSPIVPIIVDDDRALGSMNQTLLSMGIYTNCILYPAVPLGSSRFRFSLTANLTVSDIDLCLAALRQAFTHAGYDVSRTSQTSTSKSQEHESQSLKRAG